MICVIAVIACAAKPAYAQKPLDEKAFMRELQRAPKPANLTADQQAELDKVIEALKRNRTWQGEAARRFAKFGQSYFTKRDKTLCENVSLYIVGAAQSDLQQGSQDYSQTVQTLSAIQKQVYEDAMKIISNLKS